MDSKVYLCYKRAGPGDEGVLPLGDIRIIDTDEVPGKAGGGGGGGAAGLSYCTTSRGAVVPCWPFCHTHTLLRLSSLRLMTWGRA